MSAPHVYDFWTQLVHLYCVDTAKWGKGPQRCTFSGLQEPAVNFLVFFFFFWLCSFVFCTCLFSVFIRKEFAQCEQLWNWFGSPEPEAGIVWQTSPTPNKFKEEHAEKMPCELDNVLKWSSSRQSANCRFGQIIATRGRGSMSHPRQVQNPLTLHAVSKCTESRTMRANFSINIFHRIEDKQKYDSKECTETCFKCIWH